MNTSLRLIILLLLLGIGLIVAGATRMNMSDAPGQITGPASPLSSFTTGLVGVALLATGVYLLRRIYLRNQRLAPPGGISGASYVRVFALLALAVVAVIAAIVFAVVH